MKGTETTKDSFPGTITPQVVGNNLLQERDRIKDKGRMMMRDAESLWEPS